MQIKLPDDLKDAARASGNYRLAAASTGVLSELACLHTLRAMKVFRWFTMPSPS
jgi:hypothetical protein